MLEANFLKRAAQCRDLAATAFTDDARTVLLEMAEGYERGAADPGRAAYQPSKKPEWQEGL